jgi:hypothetical protein
VKDEERVLSHIGSSPIRVHTRMESLWSFPNGELSLVRMLRRVKDNCVGLGCTDKGGRFRLSYRDCCTPCCGHLARSASAASAARSGMGGRLFFCNTLLERLAQDLKDMGAELGPCIQEQHAMVGQRHLARQRHVAPADQPRIRDRMMGRATWAGRDPRRAVAGEARERCGYAWSRWLRPGSSPAGWW